MHTYINTHPWITFELDLSKATNPKLWLLLGEVKSKCEHLAGVPLRPIVAQQLHEVYLAKGVAATTAIEGNILSELQVRQQMRGQLDLPKSQEYLRTEVANVLRACKLVTKLSNRGELKPISPDVIKYYNKKVLENLPLEEGVIPGEVTHNVIVGNYRGAPRPDCEHLLERLCDWLNGDSFDHPDLPSMVQGILKAILAHLYIAWIHPYGDGNGRTARLIEFRQLLDAGVPTPAAHLLSNHYNQTRSEYYRMLSYSSQSGGDVIPLLIYALEGFLDGLKAQLKVVRDQQFDITWRSMIFHTFKDRDSKADIRQRKLIWELSKLEEEVDINKIKLSTPVLANEYATLSVRTLSRDIDELIRLRLLIYSKDRRRVKANKKIVEAFLPSGSIDGANWSTAD